MADRVRLPMSALGAALLRSLGVVEHLRHDAALAPSPALSISLRLRGEQPHSAKAHRSGSFFGYDYGTGSYCNFQI